MDLPKRIWPPVFIDDFHHRGTDLPGSATLPSVWSLVSGEFTTSDEKRLICQSPGILRYIGTSVMTRAKIANPDFAWVLRLFGQSELQCQLRVRENISGNAYIAVEINFPENTISVIEDNIVIASRSYALRTDNITYYSVELWTLSSNLYWVVINGNPALFGTYNNSHTHDGFSLEVLRIPSNGAKFSKFAVHKISAYNEPATVIDGSNLFLLFRMAIKQEIEDPLVRNWETFERARKLWTFHRDVGKSNSSWEQDGYPIREPLPEEWLND